MEVISAIFSIYNVVIRTLAGAGPELFSAQAPLPTPGTTPYDITPIPVFPFVPGQMAWLTLAIFVLLSGLILFLWQIQFRKRSKIDSALHSARREIAAIAKAALVHPLEKADVSRLSLILRRLLSVVDVKDYAALGPSELSNEAQGAASPAKQIILRLIVLIEETRFRPSQLDSVWQNTPVEAQEAVISLEKEEAVKRKKKKK